MGLPMFSLILISGGGQMGWRKSRSRSLDVVHALHEQLENVLVLAMIAVVGTQASRVAPGTGTGK